MNLRAQENYEQRLIDVEWEENTSTKEYTAHIDIYGLNRAGLLNDVLQVLSIQPEYFYCQCTANEGYEICKHPCFFQVLIYLYSQQL